MGQSVPPYGTKCPTGWDKEKSTYNDRDEVRHTIYTATYTTYTAKFTFESAINTGILKKVNLVYVEKYFFSKRVDVGRKSG